MEKKMQMVEVEVEPGTMVWCQPRYGKNAKPARWVGVTRTWVRPDLVGDRKVISGRK